MYMTPAATGPAFHPGFVPCCVPRGLGVSLGAKPSPAPCPAPWQSLAGLLRSSPGTQERVNTSVSAFFLLQLGSKAERGDIWSPLGSQPPRLAGGAGAFRQIAVWQRNPPAFANSALLQLSPSSDSFCTPLFPRDTITFCVISAGDSSTEPSHPAPPPQPGSCQAPAARSEGAGGPGWQHPLAGTRVPTSRGRAAPVLPWAEDTPKRQQTWAHWQPVGFHQPTDPVLHLLCGASVLP